MQTAIEYMGVFFGIGGGAAILQLAQSFTWTICGERLTKRLRVAAYRSIICNEIAWFDHPKNTVLHFPFLCPWLGCACSERVDIELRKHTLPFHSSCFSPCLNVWPPGRLAGSPRASPPTAP
mmetsp:Transcript_5166/g.16487  ORF Transcript_5166/g.16487 Transcript_5166/m.16487 type:complete len:122 (+) Transcript_5166:859-1224(+)